METKTIHDDLDLMWREARHHNSLDDPPFRDESARYDFVDSARERLQEIADENRDERGFEPYLYSTPEGSSRAHVNGAGYDASVREVIEDIREGVLAGALSPLFDYSVSYENASDEPTLSVSMSLRDDAYPPDYMDVRRAKTSPGPFVYSERLRQTVAKLQARINTYKTTEGDYPILRTNVTTGLKGLGQ